MRSSVTSLSSSSSSSSCINESSPASASASAGGCDATHSSFSVRMSVSSGGGARAVDDERDAGVDRQVTLVRDTALDAGMGRCMRIGVELELAAFVRSPNGEPAEAPNAFVRADIHVSGTGGTGGTGGTCLLPLP